MSLHALPTDVIRSVIRAGVATVDEMKLVSYYRILSIFLSHFHAFPTLRLLVQEV